MLVSHTIKFITIEFDFGFEQLQLMTKQLHHSHLSIFLHFHWYHLPHFRSLAFLAETFQENKQPPGV